MKSVLHFNRHRENFVQMAAVAGHGFGANQDLPAQLLALNLGVAARTERGELVTAPGIPPGYPGPQRLVAADCIRPVAGDNRAGNESPQPT